jgi:hypothetical protein
VAGAFRPTYEIERESRQRVMVRLRDPSGRRPDLSLRHRGDRRLFFRANYLRVEADVPGNGPATDGVLAFRFRGPLSRQRVSLRWRSEVPGGEQWLQRLEEPLLAALRDVDAVESFQVRWRSRDRTWHLELETLSGSMVGGFMTAMPIEVPLDPREVRGIIGLIDGLVATAT